MPRLDFRGCFDHGVKFLIARRFRLRLATVHRVPAVDAGGKLPE